MGPFKSLFYLALIRYVCNAETSLIRSPKWDGWWLGSNVGRLGVFLSSNTPES